MPFFSNLIFNLVSFASKNGLTSPHDPKLGRTGSRAEGGRSKGQAEAKQTGIRGETFAYWHLRRHGYVIISKNYTAHGIKGEIDLIGYDGEVLAFIEVKTRTTGDRALGTPEEAVTPEKRRNLSRMARHFLAEQRIPKAQCRFDVLAIENRSGKPPLARLHKGAFTEQG
jgi:putative endonuclease